MDPKFLKSIGNLEDKVQSLSDPDEIKKTYLNCSILDSELAEFVAEEIKENPDGIHLTNNEYGLSITYVIVFTVLVILFDLANRSKKLP